MKWFPALNTAAGASEAITITVGNVEDTPETRCSSPGNMFWGPSENGAGTSTNTPKLTWIVVQLKKKYF